MRPIAEEAGEPSPARSVSRSHVGRVRTINEDRVFDSATAGLWAVADGMGGHRGGDLAAQTVVDALRGLAGSRQGIAIDQVEAVLTEANAAIAVRNRTLGLDAGATVVVALIDGTEATIAWAGDSRAYRLRAGRAEPLTRDHSVVQELIDAGLLTAEAAERHPHANVITRALGVDDSVALDRVSVELRAGDRLLLCSDGLSRSLADAGCDAVDLDRLADTLLDHALRVDGSDNISLVLIERVDESAG